MPTEPKLRPLPQRLLWFAALWLVLRWDTNRRANRLLRRWALAPIESDVSLPGAVARWTDELLEPIRRRADEATSLTKRIEAFKTSN